MADLAAHMHVSESTVRRYLAEGLIPKSCTVHIGRGSHVRIFTERLRAAGILAPTPAVMVSPQGEVSGA